MPPCLQSTSKIPSCTYTGPSRAGSPVMPQPPLCHPHLHSGLQPCQATYRTALSSLRLAHSPLTAENTARSPPYLHAVYLANSFPAVKSQKASPDPWALVGALCARGTRGSIQMLFQHIVTTHWLACLSTLGDSEGLKPCPIYLSVCNERLGE